MAKKFQDLTGIIAHDKQANQGKYHPHRIDIATYTDNRDISEDICGTATHTKKHLLENDPSVVHLSEGRGENNQQPTPNDNNKRVVVFLCGSGR